MEPSPATPRPSSRLAIVSFVLGVASWVAWCAYFIIFARILGDFDISDPLGGSFLDYITVFGGPLLVSLFTITMAFVGLILGARSLIGGHSGRRFAWIGLGLSFLCLVPYVVLFLIALGSGGAAPAG